MTGTVALVAPVALVRPGVAGDLTAAAAGTEASASAAQIPVPTSPIPITRALRSAGAGAAPPARDVAPAAREIPRIRSPPFASACVPSRRGQPTAAAIQHDRAASYGEINVHARKHAGLSRMSSLLRPVIKTYVRYAPARSGGSEETDRSA